MELKVGDYVRTEAGVIGKIIIKGNIKSLIGKDEPYVILDIDENKKEDYKRTLEDEITKSKPNITDLIQEGDYVNGKEIIQIINNELYFDTNDMSDKISFKEKDIKTIVTKEQFKSMEYRIEGNK